MPEPEPVNESPKRKRPQPTPPTTTHITSHPQLQSDLVSNEEGSPSTKVTGRLRRLVLSNDQLDLEADGEPGNAKRQRRSVEDDLPSSSPTPGASVVSSEGKTDLTSPPTSLDQVRDSGAQEPLQDRPGSPKLSGEINPFYWQDSEITGHDPVDPADDGYGINGIGFRPTSAQKYQQQQKRKQQVEGYRTREAREARQKRSERRRTTFSDDATEAAGNEQKRVKVRFDD